MGMLKSWHTSCALISPSSDEEWSSYHRIRRTILFEKRGQFGVDDPNRPKATETTFAIEPLWKEPKARVGNSFNLRFRAKYSGPAQPNQKLEDIGVLVFLAPGTWQHREVAKPLGNGVYEINFVPPEPGIYYVYVQCPSLEIRYNQMQPLTIEAIKTSTAAND